MTDVNHDPYDWQIHRAEEMLVLEDPEPPYALFIGGVDGWRDTYTTPSSQVFMTRPALSMEEVIDFVGTPFLRMRGQGSEGGELIVYSRLMSPGRAAEPNTLAAFFLGEGVPNLFAGPIVVTDGVDLL